MSPCPSEDALLELDARAQEHLDECEDCRALVAAIARDRDATPRMGRYAVLETVGAGGMGLVYAAYDPELDRKVALKILQPGNSSESGRERVVREGKAMARLSHPNVVEIYAVESEADRVFIAMELVDGGSLETWVQAGPRGWREIRDIYCAAGRGLAAAHAAGLIHRDFKPANVLVGKDGRARVTDFGLTSRVKAAGEQAPPAGTLRYAAPEQLEGGQTDARADQFAFCVSLFRALGGQDPFEGDTPEARLRSIRAGPRAPPGSATAPAWIWRALTQGLAPAPAARYASMDLLIAALEKNPRAAKWTAAMTAAACVVLVGAGWAIQRTAHARLQRCDAAGKWTGIWDAEQRARFSRAFHDTRIPYADASFLTMARSLDAYQASWSAAFSSSCQATLEGRQSDAQLDRQMACLTRRLQEVRALAEIWSAPDAEVVVQAPGVAAELPRAATCLDASARPATGAVAALRSNLDRTWAFTHAGRATTGLTLAKEALADAQTLRDSQLTAESELAVGHAVFRLGDFEAARSAFQEAGRAGEAAGDDELVARAWMGGSDALSRLGRYDDALEHARWADGALARLHQPPELEASLASTRGKSLLALGRLSEARAAFAEGLRIREQSLPPEHPALASSWKDLGALALREENVPEAIRCLERALALRERALGADHPDIATVLTDLGRALIRAGRETEAASDLERALRLRRQALGPDHPDVATTLCVLAELHSKNGDSRQAEQELALATQIRTRALGAEHPSTLEVARQLEALRKSGQPSAP